MDSAFDDIAFLARSPNRVDALDSLASSPRTRRELGEAMDASRVTVSRAISDLADRRWITNVDGVYRATPTGELVCAEFNDLREAVSVADTLRDVAESFPREWLSFDLRRLDDATIAVPTETEPTAPVRLATECMAGASRVRLVAQSVTTEVLTVQQERVDAGELTAEIVLSEALAEAIARQPRLSEQIAALLDAGALDLYRYPGAVPGTIGVYDDERTVFGFVDDGGRPSAAIVTADPVVKASAEATVDDYRERSERISASALGR